jgi:hypothetical protein
MARPVYIVCARSGSEDKDTGLLSLFELLEKFMIVRVDPGKPANAPTIVQPLQLRMVATWMIETDQGERYDDSFEYEFRLVMPPKPTIHFLGGGTFKFIEPQPLHRFTLRIEAPLPFEGPGVMWVQSVVRKPGKEWIQSYPIFLEEIPMPSPSAPSPPPS